MMALMAIKEQRLAKNGSMSLIPVGSQENRSFELKAKLERMDILCSLNNLHDDILNATDNQICICKFGLMKKVRKVWFRECTR